MSFFTTALPEEVAQGSSRARDHQHASDTAHDPAMRRDLRRRLRHADGVVTSFAGGKFSPAEEKQRDTEADSAIAQ
jgi:hypothetical protein